MPTKAKLPAQLPLLPLDRSVLLPGAFTRVTLGFKRANTFSEPLLQHLLAQQGEHIFVAAAPVIPEFVVGPDGSEEAVSLLLNDVAVAARVLQMSRNTQDDTWVILLEGWCRIRLQAAPKKLPLQGFMFLNVKQLGPSKNDRFKEVELDKDGQDLAVSLQLGTSKLSQLLGQSVGSTATGRLADMLQRLSPPAAADMLASMLTQSVSFKQQVLEAVDHNERLRLAVTLVQQTLELLKGTAKESAEESDAQNKQLALRRQAYHLLQRAPAFPGSKLGGGEPDEEDEEELSALMGRLKAANPPAEVLKVARREHRRLKKSNEQHPGYAMSRAYLETLADLPWSTFSGQKKEQVPTAAPTSTQEDAGHTAESSSSVSEDQEEATSGDANQAAADSSIPCQPSSGQASLAEARQLLDAEHYGLDKVKDRIVQYLAVRRLRGPDARAPILCFVGPPGTGKTSLATSIAKVLQRPFQRVSVGGIRDEAEIRGHRRTYIGAMPGRIIQSVRRSGVRDPVLLLDEVDKMGHDSLRGDPAAALLEVLDPNQNHAFVDTYLSVAFDLSQVVFVATANQLQGMSGPLLDRLEIIQLSGYTLEEKEHIAQRHLIPGVLQEHGLGQDQLVFPSGALQLIADGYTREAGVRGLSRSLAAICRHIAVQIVSQEDARLKDESSELTSRPFVGHHSSPQRNLPLPQTASASGQPRYQHHHDADVSHTFTAGSTATSTMHQASPLMPEMSSSGVSASELSATASAGGFAWGNLWGGLRGALVSPKAPGTSSLGHSQAIWSTARHSRSIQQSLGASEQDSATSTEQLQQQLPLSNPYGGVNADMEAGEAPALPCITVTAELIEEVLGPRKYNELDSADSLMSPGSVAGLVWTAAGGQVQYVECCCTSKGQSGRSGKLVLTGQAGEVLQESAHLALSWIRSHSHQLQQAANSSTHLQHRSTTDCAHVQASADLGAAQTSQLDDSSCRQRADGHGDVSLQQRQAASTQDGISGTKLSEGSASPLAAHFSMQQHDSHPYAEACAVHSAGPDFSAQTRSASPMIHSTSQAHASPSGLSADHDSSSSVQAGEQSSGRAGQAESRAHDEQHAVAVAAAQWDVHVHLPAGAVSKDGPSAGITLATALVSLFLDRCVREDTAMTGELTLRGLVLPIGGLKEKLLAAHHAGIKRVLVPKRNWRDIKADVPANIKDSLEIVAVHVLEDVLQHAFNPPLVLQPLSKF